MIYELRFTNFMEEFFGKVGLALVLALAMAGLVCVLDRCQEGDSCGWCSGATPEDAAALEVYEAEALGNSLPPCGE